VTEYCQWKETRHEEREWVGKDPDFCGAASRGQESCSNVDCRSRSVGGCARDGCCKIFPGADIYRPKIWFSYSKGWSPHKISSIFFDNPVAYHNPSRDPAPALTLYPGDEGVVLAGRESDSLRIDVSDLGPVLGPWVHVGVSKRDAEGLPAEALSAGLHESDHLFFYSRVPSDGWENPVVRSVGSWLVDGVLDANSIARGTGLENLLEGAGLAWITRGTCNAGDVRVHVEARELPRQGFSVLATQRGNHLVQHLYGNKRLAVTVLPGVMSKEALLEAVISSSKWWVMAGRSIVGIVLLLPMATLVARIRSDFSDAPFFLVTAFAGGLASSLLLGSQWWLYYGPQDCVLVFVLTAALLALFVATLVLIPSGAPSQQSSKEKDL